jgi:hypothetical protein
MWGYVWGSGWGYFSGDGGVFSVAAARAVASNAVRVAFTQPPMMTGGVSPTDALNLANWTLSVVDGGEVISLLTSRPVAGAPLVVELVIAGRFDAVDYLVAATNLVSTGGQLLAAPKSATFRGMGSARAAIDETQPLVDILNPQTQKAINGSLVVGSNGDYRLESGVQLLKKLIYRRLTTAQGAFYHLAGISYGLGLRSKEFYTPSGLIVLKSNVEGQVRLEPEVGDVRATLTLSAKGALNLALQVKLRTTDQKISFSFPIQQSTSL